VVAVQHPGDYAGNHVVVEIAPGVFATYAHLQPGSLAVRVGERVTPGQRLGRLGNSGNTTAPHLHFQISDGPDIVTANSLPFVFDRYTLAGTVDAETVVPAFTEPSAPALVIAGPPQAQSATYPLVLTVQDFR
jgi:murein DD-endopeptidase MepM/ murein hydrolase activator NlpD